MSLTDNLNQDLLQSVFYDISRPETQDPQAVSDAKKQALALMPFSFVSEWKQWTRNPQYSERPETLDNTWFLCEHRGSRVDFKNISKFDPEYSLIDLNSWDTLCSLWVSVYPL